MQKYLQRINPRQAIIALIVILIVIVALNFLIFGRGGSAPTNPGTSTNPDAENRPTAPIFGTDKTSSIATLRNQLPIFTDDCLIALEGEETTNTKLVIYRASADVSLDVCGASLFLKQNKFYLTEIEIIVLDSIPGHEPYAAN
jgi:hypothetical protein